MEIAGYRVQEKVHEGGMAVLYRVTPPAGAETCLLKMPKLGFGSDPACYAGFDVEQMILGRMAGPHVPRLFAKGESDFGPYLVIEHIAGAPLSDYACRAPLPAEEVARLGAALASAVHDLHRQEVDRSLVPWLAAIRGHVAGLARYGWLPGYHWWAGRFMLGMRPRQRRIARMIVWISLLEFVVFLFVAAIFWLERQGG